MISSTLSSKSTTISSLSSNSSTLSSKSSTDFLLLLFPLLILLHSESSAWFSYVVLLVGSLWLLLLLKRPYFGFMDIVLYVSKNMNHSYVCCFVCFILLSSSHLLPAWFPYSQIYFYSLCLVFVTVFPLWGFSQLCGNPWLNRTSRMEALTSSMELLCMKTTYQLSEQYSHMSGPDLFTGGHLNVSVYHLLSTVRQFTEKNIPIFYPAKTDTDTHLVASILGAMRSRRQTRAAMGSNILVNGLSLHSSCYL